MLIKSKLVRRAVIALIPIIFVFLSSALVTGQASSAVEGQQATPRPIVSAPGGPYAVVLVVDAARYDQFDLSRMPNLARLASTGTVFTDAWAGLMPSITETAHSTIGTGDLPYHHLVLGDTWRVPGTEQMAPNLLNGQLTRTGYIGKFIQSTHSTTVSEILRTRYPRTPVITLSGHKVYAADAMGGGSADYVLFGARDTKGHFVPMAIPGHMPAQSVLSNPQLALPEYPRQPGIEDAWTASLAIKLVGAYHPRLLMVNFPEVDVNGHIVGTDATVMQPLMTNIDLQIGRIVDAYRQAGILNRTTFVVTADHGMVPAIHTVDSTLIETIIKQAGGLPLYVGHGDYSPVWLRNAAAVPRVSEALAGANIPHVAAVYAKTVNGRYVLVSSAKRLADPQVQHAYGDLLASFDSAESPDIVLLYDENTVTMTPYYQKIGRKGDHGGATWGAQHIPLVIAGPGVKHDIRSNFPARLVDIAPTIETLMNTTPRRQDGIPLANIMVNPPAWAVAQQNAVSARLTASERALAREAALRPNNRRSGNAGGH